MTVASRVALAGALLGLAALAACSAAERRREPWGAAADRRVRAEAAALSSGDAYEPLRYWDDRVAFDFWGIGPGQAEQIPRATGVAQAVSVVNFYRFEIDVQDVYLADSGSFSVEHWREPPDDTIGVLRRVGPQGDEVVRGFLRLVGRGDIFDYRRVDLAARLQPLVAAYTSAWTSGSAEGLASLYAPGATVDDGSGPQAWRDAAEAAAGGVALRASQGLAPEAALYAYAPVDEPFSEAVVLFDLLTDADCPVRVAQLWRLDGDRITSDTRFAEVSSSGQCLPEGQRPRSWWANLPVPELPEDRNNATFVTTGGREVPLYNATPAMEELLRWGSGQFAADGLEVPVPERVVFEPSRGCRDAAGGAQQTPAGFVVAVCYTDATACTDPTCASYVPSARLFMLHELAHVWASEHLSAADQERFVAAAGLPGWLGPDIPYEQRGAEHAAETLAWGLDGGVHDLYRNLPSPGCAVVAEHFRLLTGHAPLTRCPATS